MNSFHFFGKSCLWSFVCLMSLLFCAESRAQESAAAQQILDEISEAEEFDPRQINRSLAALQLAEKQNSPPLKIRARLLTASLFEKNSDYRRAFLHFRQAYFLAQNAHLQEFIYQSLPGIGRLHLKTGQADSALFYFRQSRALCGGACPEASALSGEIGKFYFETGQADSAKYYLSESLHFNRPGKASRAESENRRKLAEIFKRTYLYDSALNYLRKTEPAERKEAAVIALDLAEIFYLKDEYDSAAVQSKKAETGFGKNISSEDKGKIFLIKGLIYSKMREIEKAKNAFDSAQIFYEKSAKKNEINYELLSIADARLAAGADSEALTLYRKIRRSGKFNPEIHRADALLHFANASCGMAEILLKRGAAKEAEKTMDGLQEAVRKLDYPDCTARTEITLALIAAENKQAKQAVAHAETALHYAGLTNYLPFKALIFTKAAEVFGLSGQSRRSVETYRRAAQLTDNYRQLLTDRKLAEMKMMAENQEKHQELEVFRQKDEISQKIINNQRLGSALVVLVLLFVSVLTLYINRSKRQIKTTNRQLLEQKKELGAALDRQQQLQSRLVQSEKTGTLGMITAAVAHEINNPVNFVSGGAESLRVGFSELFELVGLYAELSETKDPILRAELLTDLEELLELDSLETRKEDALLMLEGILTGAGRIAEVVRALQMFVRADENAVKEMDLHQNLDACLFILKNQIFEKARLEQDFAENLPKIEASPAEINQVFVSLVTNAIEAIQGTENGLLTVRTREEEDNMVSVSFKDSGKGIAPELHEKIFSPLFTDNPEQKSGMGLAVVKEILDRAGGKISLISGPGHGSEFIVYLPVKVL